MSRATLLLAALPLAAPLALAASGEPAKLDNAAVEDLAFRTYLHARLGDRENALKYASLALEARPGHPATLLALASLWESERDAQRLHATAMRLLAEIPDDDRALFFKASAEYLLRNYAEARETLLDNKRVNFRNERDFPYDATLADSAARAGDWRTAIAARTRLVGSDGDPAAAARNRRILDDLLRSHLSVLSADASLAAAPGRFTLHTLRAACETPVTARTRISGMLTNRHASLFAADGYAATSVDRQEALAAVEYEFDTELSFGGSLGASDTGDPRASLSVTHRLRESGKLGLMAEYDAPAEDDAPYLAANLRQSRLIASYNDLWTERTGASVSGGLRSLHAPEHGPGNPGWVFSGELFHQSRQRTPKVTPYLQTIWISNPRNEPVSAALSALRSDGATVDAEGTFDLQKAGVRFDFPLKTTASLGFDTYAGSSLLDGGLLAGASGELRWRPVKSLTVRLGSGWDRGNIFGSLPSGIVRAFAAADWTF